MEKEGSMPEANRFRENRVYPRIPVNIPIQYRLVEAPREVELVLKLQRKWTHSRALNLSLGGMYLEGDQGLKVDDILRFDISLPNKSTPITVFAEVVWANETGAGLHFMAVKAQNMESLKAYLYNASLP
jgi:hypothetical protein